MKRLIEDEQEFKSSIDYVFRDPILYGDYRNALEMGEPRIYEDLQDYEASKALFEQVFICFCYLFSYLNHLFLTKKSKQTNCCTRKSSIIIN